MKRSVVIFGRSIPVIQKKHLLKETSQFGYYDYEKLEIAICDKFFHYECKFFKKKRVATFSRIPVKLIYSGRSQRGRKQLW